jgi:hypothetical protein
LTERLGQPGFANQGAHPLLAVRAGERRVALLVEEGMERRAARSSAPASDHVLQVSARHQFQRDRFGEHVLERAHARPARVIEQRPRGRGHR